MRINIELSQKSIQSAIKQIENCRDKLIRKNREFVKRLGEVGIPVIDSNIAVAAGDSDKTHDAYIKINSFGDYAQATLIVSGKDLLFIEFGAGVHYNGAVGSSPHPLGASKGYTIGSYGKGNGSKDAWYYYSDTGEVVKSHGTQATMTVYKAGVEMRQQMLKIAKERFICLIQ